MRRISLQLILLVGVVSAYLLLQAQAEGDAPAPTTELSPVDVVLIQLEAMERDADQGIRTAFRFASPGNRATTGPLDRFERMVRSESYAPLLGHARAEVGMVHSVHGRAAIPVIVTGADGSEHGYMFILSRQSSESCNECWMTDSVVPHPLPKPAGQLI